MSAPEMDIAYIIDADISSELCELRLPNGETILQRQLRLLWMCGVRDFIIEAGQEREQAVQYLPDGGRLLAEQMLFDKALKRSVFFVQSNVVFDLECVEAMLREKGAFAALTHERDLPGRKARVGMRTIEEIASGLEGPNCFPLMPVCRLPADAARRALQLTQKENLRLEGVIWPLVSTLGVSPYFVDTGFARLLQSRKELEEVYPMLRKRDKACRIFFRERGAVARVFGLLARLGVRKPLLVCGDPIEGSLVKELLSAFGIESSVQQVEGFEPQLEQIRRGMEIFRAEGCNGILSAGGAAAIEAAKCEALFLRCGGEQSIQVHTWCPHIAIPMKPSDLETASRIVYTALSGPCSLEHDGLLPDAVLQDSGFWDGLRLQTTPLPVAGSLESLTRKPQGISGTLRGKALFTLYKVLFSIRDQTVLLEAYSGGADAHRAVYEAMQNEPMYDGFTYIWAADDPSGLEGLQMVPEMKVVAPHSRQYIRVAATARFLISSVDLPEYVRPRQEQTYIHTWNGESDNRGRDGTHITHLHSPGPAATPYLKAAFSLPKMGREGIVVELGCPQNAFLFRYTKEDALSVKLKLGLPLNKKLVLWTLTQQPIDFQRLCRELDGCLLLIWGKGAVDIGELRGFVLDVRGYGRLNDLFIISDLLVTDDACLVQRYANLKRPVVFYRPPGETGRRCPGYLDCDELPGETVSEFSALAGAIHRGLRNFQYDEKYRRFQEKYNPLEGPDAGLRFVEKLIPAATFPTPRQKKQQRFHSRIYNGWIRGRGFLRKTGLWRTQNDKRLLSFRNKHRGGRCFLVGNGPSLTLSDLELIRNEYSFGCNKVYLIFDRTNWRPTYYFVTDNVFSGQALTEIRAAFSGVMFSNNAFDGVRQQEKRLVYVHTLTRDVYSVHGNPLDYYVSSQATVMTYMIEMAMYMGFEEIYLLGVDCSNSFISGDNHFANGYYDKDMMRMEKRRTKLLASDGKQMTMEELGAYRQDRSLLAYAKLRKYAESHGVKIFNATRGGYLEVFDRVDLENLKL